jgi:hypothetical protein
MSDQPKPQDEAQSGRLLPAASGWPMSWTDTVVLADKVSQLAQ